MEKKLGKTGFFFEGVLVMSKLLGRLLFPAELRKWKKFASGVHSEAYLNEQKTLVRQVTTECSKELFTLGLLPSIEGVVSYPQAERVVYDGNAMILEMPKYTTLPSLEALSAKQRELISAIKQFSCEFDIQVYVGDMSKRIRGNGKFSPDILEFLAESVEAYGNYHNAFTFDYAIRNIKYCKKTHEVILLDVFYALKTPQVRKVLSEVILGGFYG